MMSPLRGNGSDTLDSASVTGVYRRRAISNGGDQGADRTSIYPPSFAESQFATIIRRQRKRRNFSPLDDALERGPSFTNLAQDARVRDDTALDDDGGVDRRGRSTSDSVQEREEPEPQLKLGRHGVGPASMGRHAWEFAGWGECQLLELKPRDYDKARKAIEDRPARQLGQWQAAAIAGNAILGSVFYSLPAVLSAAGVYAPISLFVACILIGPFRPILLELSSALGASDSVNYGYFSNISTRSIALIAAAITALDAITTAAVSASTAASYLDAETPGRVGTVGWTVILLAMLTTVACLGLRDSSRVALGMMSLHLGTMAVLIVAGIVFWARQGSAILSDNWHNADLLLNGKSVARALFDGICIGFVGLTGFECAPSYVTRVKEGQFAPALRWLQVIVLVTEAPLMLLCLVAIPTSTLAVKGGSSANILALLADIAGGSSPWLKIIVIVDAVVVLSGGIITGIISFNGLSEALAG